MFDILMTFPSFRLPTCGTTRSVLVSADRRFTSFRRSTSVVQRCLFMTTDPGDLVLDPTCGSGTTAYVAEQWGRRWITIDTSRVALALARTRLDVGEVPLLPARRLARGAQEGSRTDRPRAAELPDRPRHPQGIRLQARPPRHAQVDRQQSRHPRRDDPRRDRRRNRPPCRDRDALRSALRGQEPHPGQRSVHGREPVARPDRLDRRGTAGIRADRPEATRAGPTSRR